MYSALLGYRTRKAGFVSSFTFFAHQAHHCKNMQKAREVWDNIMTKGNAKYANMWLEYYNLERFVRWTLKEGNFILK